MKKSLLLYIIIAVTLLSGCSYEVDGWEVRNAQATCKDRGGIQKIVVSPVGTDCVYCGNGTWKLLTRPTN
jgi:protein involved in sex pheromone biosynthesis